MVSWGINRGIYNKKKSFNNKRASLSLPTEKFLAKRFSYFTLNSLSRGNKNEMKKKKTWKGEIRQMQHKHDKKRRQNYDERSIEDISMYVCEYLGDLRSLRRHVCSMMLNFCCHCAHTHTLAGLPNVWHFKWALSPLTISS